MSNPPVMRRIVTSAQVNQSTALRRSQFDQRFAVKQAEEIEQREAQGYESDITAEALSTARRDNKDVVLDEQQQLAINMMRTEQFGCLIGSAGSGKTTTMKQGLAAIENDVSRIDWMAFRSVGSEVSNEPRVPAIALCCFTNVAARNLAAKLDPKWGKHCMSIHSLLAFAPVETEDFDVRTGKAKFRFEPRYTSANPLPLDAVIIDEAGIVNRDLWNTFLDACPPQMRIYLLGDLAQLPAMQGVSPLPFALKKWPTVTLTKIYRQADDSPIIDNLTRIRRGLEPVNNSNYFRCGQLEMLDHDAMKARKHISGYISALFKRGLWDPRQDIIITPQNEAMLGQAHWNGAFRLQFNPPKKDENGRLTNPPILVGTALGGNMLAVGDKVMAMDNGGRSATEHRFVNGSIGIITSIVPNPAYTGDASRVGELVHDTAEDEFDWSDIDGAMHEMDISAIEDAAADMEERDNESIKSRQASHIVTVVEQATGEVFRLTRSAEIASLSHAYAATCHKFQGSQARNVIVIVHSSMNFGLNREWLYTACSRAQERVFLLHEPKALSTAVSRQQLPGSNPQEKADRLLKIYSGKQWAAPYLPEEHKL